MADSEVGRSSGRRLSRRTLVGAMAGVCVAVLSVAAVGSATTPSVVRAALARLQAGPSSRLLLPADFDEIRAKIAEQAWARDSFAALRRAADGLVASLPPIPDQGGGWFHAGGAAYEITRVHNRLSEGARTLGLVYRLTDDVTYAQTAARILLGYATRYDAYELHDNTGRTGPAAVSPGKATSQGLDEGIWLAALAFGHDLVRETLTDADRTTIENGVLRPAAELLMRNNVGRHNHQTYFNLGIGLTGLAIGDSRYVEHAVQKPDSGLLYQLSSGASYTADGFWYEGSAHYHFYALEGIVGLAEAAQRNGLEPYAAPALRAAFDFPLSYADAQGRLPAFNDGPPASLYDAGRARLYEIGYRRFGDPRYAALLARVGRGSAYHGLVYGVAALPEGDPFTCGQEPSALLADRTLPILRAGPESSRLQLSMNAMPYVGGHSQPAHLEIDLTGGHGRLVPAPASIKYADPLYPGWYRQTISHSTVVVDGTSQARGRTTEVVGFHAGTLFSAVRARSSSAYPGAVLDRTSILTEAGLVDLFLARAPGARTLDWVLHHSGSLSTELTLQPRAAPAEAGYQQLGEVGEARVDEDWRAHWTLPDGSASALWMAGLTGTTVLTGLGPIGAANQENDPQPVSALIVRRPAPASAFVSVLLPGDVGTASVLGVPALRDGAPVGAEEAFGVQIRTPGGAYDIYVAPGLGPYDIGGRRVDGSTIVVERPDGSGSQTEQAALA